ncbi:hypothetical protein [Antrihabitans spumae]|uniref:Uncharacterized protein n=1 Tax=Antrihabitans spumae TaxID=3373370 RepID=A0ABW7K7F7_9NOCA
MTGFFGDRRRACALLLHAIQRRNAQGEAVLWTGVVRATDGEVHSLGISEILREAAEAGRSSELTRAVLAVVLDVVPDFALLVESIEAELASAAHTEVDEVENGD